MAIPWMPREVSSRLFERPHELENVKTAYFMSTAYAAGFLAREDGRRPAWFSRARLAPLSTVVPELQEHLASACHVICLKLRQEVTSEPAKRGLGGADRPPTGWQAGLLCARVIWRTLFAAAAAKAPASKAGVPVLFMGACEGLRQAARRLLTQVWSEVQLQFTSKAIKYRNIKSRPAWALLEALQYRAFAEESGFGLHDPAQTPPSSAGSKPAAGLQDFFEEVLALRFTIDWLSASMQDAEDFLEQATRRAQKAPARKHGSRSGGTLAQPAAPSECVVDSFGMMWTDDAELRGVASLAARLMDGLEGPGALQSAATFTGQMLLALWKGVQPLLVHHASMSVARIAESHAVAASLPPPALPELDADRSHSAAFDRVALSRGPPSQACRELVGTLPRSVIAAIVRAQAVFRGYLFRARHCARARSVAAYCKAAGWPQLQAVEDGDDQDTPREDRKRRRRKAGKLDPSRLKEEIADFQPQVSKYLGGDPTRPSVATAIGFRSTASLGASAATADVRRSWPMPTADHRACADLFALYLYNVYRRRELTRTWQTLCGAYERGMDAYAELLNKNPALKPMLDSIAAQLKRGSVSGYDKTFVAKQRRESDSASQSSRAMADISSPKGRQTPKEMTALPRDDSAATLRMATLAPLPKMGPTQSDVSGEYLTNYLKEMDGDDSQFKDITAAVIPLSTGASPPRRPPHEIIQTELQAGQPPEAAGRPRLDVPFCMQKVRPMWLPIKAHRFAAYRAKVLQLLPQQALKQYVDFEKQGQYAACIKLLESATPGSLNVLSPATLVNNKPLLVETVLQLIVGYSGLCLKNQQGAVAVKLINQVIDSMSLSLRDLHPTHRMVLEAYLYDTALSICYYMPSDISMSDRSASFFQQASERYLRLGHPNRYCKCCLRSAAVLHNQGNHGEAEYYTQKALSKLADAPMSSLVAVCYHNLSIHTLLQRKAADAVAHVRSYVALLRQLPKLGNSWMQQMDTTQWLVLKAQELWPQFQLQASMRDGQAATKFGY